MDFPYLNRGELPVGGGLAVVVAQDGCALPTAANATGAIGISGDGPIAVGKPVSVRLMGSVTAALLAPGESVAILDVLGIANSDGHLKKWSAGSKVARALRAYDNSAGESPLGIMVQVL